MCLPHASTSPGMSPVPCCGLWGKGSVSQGWRDLSPGHPLALGWEPQHLSLSAIPISPIPAPQPLLPSSPPTAAAQQLDELLANLGHLQNKVSLVPWGREVGGLALTHPSPSSFPAAGGCGARSQGASGARALAGHHAGQPHPGPAGAGHHSCPHWHLRCLPQAHCWQGEPCAAMPAPLLSASPGAALTGPRLLAGAHGPGQDLAPRTLCLCPLRGGAGRPALL